MTEKSKNRVCLKTPPIITNSSLSIVRRGRPKGSKNKPKSSHLIDVLSPAVTHKAKKRGRPKGVKNKPKSSPAVENIISSTVQKNRTRTSAPSKKQSSDKSTEIEDHPLLKALKWLEKYMHPAEMQYYRSRATKLGVSLHVAMASDVLGLFNVQDPEICKQIKKNNFIANNNSYVIH